MKHTLLFHAAGTRAVSFEVEAEGGGVSLVALYHPERERDVSAYATAEDAADGIEDRVREHFDRDPVRRITCRGEPVLVGIPLLGRYAVPILIEDTGQR